MQCSHNELEMLLRKAVVGAGFPVGTAAEVARAGLWLSRCGYDGAGAVVDGVHNAPRPISCQPSPTGFGFSNVQVVLAGPAALDCIFASPPSARIEMADIDVPLLLIGMIGAAVERTTAALVFDCNGRELVIDGTGCPMLHPLSSHSRAIIRHADSEVATHSSPLVPPDRISVNTTSWQKVLELAAQTYVPASDQSRLQGAGAGLTDND